MELLDETDKRILNLLQKNAVQSIKEVADKVSLSASPTYERIKRLEKTGVIHKYIALLDKEKIGKNMVAICNVSVTNHSKSTLQKFEDAIVRFEEVMEVHCMSGTYDYLLKIVTKDVQSYHEFVMHKLSSITDIAQVQSSFVMKEIKAETAFRLI